jgi:nucleoside-diphosphate-sugar epimerase
VPLTEEVPTRGSREHYYSQQKADCEALLRQVTDGSGLEVYVLRPCIVAGPKATALADSMPWNQVPEPLAGWSRAAGRLLPPLFPDPGVKLQLVHHDDVAEAIAAATLGRGSPGAYNLAADGEVTVGDVVRAVGGRSVRVPRALAVVASQLLARMPWTPALAEWVHTGRTSVVMDTSKAKRELGWRPAHTSEQTLQAMTAVL